MVTWNIVILGAFGKPCLGVWKTVNNSTTRELFWTFHKRKLNQKWILYQDFSYFCLQSVFSCGKFGRFHYMYHYTTKKEKRLDQNQLNFLHIFFLCTIQCDLWYIFLYFVLETLWLVLASLRCYVSFLVLAREEHVTERERERARWRHTQRERGQRERGRESRSMWRTVSSRGSNARDTGHLRCSITGKSRALVKPPSPRPPRAPRRTAWTTIKPRRTRGSSRKTHWRRFGCRTRTACRRNTYLREKVRDDDAAPLPRAGFCNVTARCRTPHEWFTLIPPGITGSYCGCSLDYVRVQIMQKTVRVRQETNTLLAMIMIIIILFITTNCGCFCVHPHCGQLLNEK